MRLWIQLAIVILTLYSNTFADDAITSGENSATDIARLWTAGLDSPSMHWANVVNLSEILNMLDDNEWDITEEDLKQRWKMFLSDHKDALELYQQLQEISQENAARRLLSTESATTSNTDASNWMQTWMQSFSSLMKDVVQGNSADSSSIVETLRTQLLTESVDPGSVSEISKLFKSLFEELTYQPEERQEPTDVWGRMEQAMVEVQTLQRKATLTKSVLEAIEAYSSCRSDSSVLTVVSCLKSLTDALEALVSQYDSQNYTSQGSEPEDSTLLSSFRADIETAMTTYTTCQEYKNLIRISCLGDWWSSVLEMEKKYSGMDSSTLSPADASLVELLKKMLSLEKYVSGTNPEMKTESRDEEKVTLREFIASAINRRNSDTGDNANTETSILEAVRKITTSLRDFISNIGVFSRVGSTTPSRSSGIKRRLLSEGEETSPILAYLQDLNQISQTIRSVLEYRNRMTDSSGQQTVVDRLQRLLTLQSPNQDSTSSGTGTLSSSFGQRVASYVLDRIFNQASDQEATTGSIVRRFIEQRIAERQPRKLLMEDSQLDQLYIQSTHGNRTYEASLDYLQQSFREKAIKSLERLGEVKAITRRRLHQSDEESVKAFLDDIRPHREELRPQSDTHHRSLRSSTNTKASNALQEILKKQENDDVPPGVRYVGELIGQTVDGTQRGQNTDQTVNRNELAMLDAILKRYFGKSLSEVIADAVATTRQVFKATTGIIAHDVHDRSDRDGMPHETVHLTDLPNESYQILSQVGRTAASLSKVQETVRNYTTRHSSAKNHANSHRHKSKSGKIGDSSRALLASYPDQGQPIEVTKSFATQTLDAEVPEDDIDLHYNPTDEGEFVAEDAFFSDELVPLSSEPVDIEMPRTEFLMSMLTPQLYGVSSDDFSDVYELENPNWWRGRTLYVPEAQHLEYEFDFESQDEKAPVHKGLGSLMKYHLWQDMNRGETKGNPEGFTMLELIVFFAGIWTGLFIAFISLGIVLLNREQSRRAMKENSYLTDAEARSALSPSEFSKMQNVGRSTKSDLSIKAVA